MGAKRPLEVEDFPELSFKQSKQLDYNNNLMLNTDDFPSHSTTLRVDSPVEVKSNFCKSDFDGGPENGDRDYASIADQEVEASAPFSLITSCNSQEDDENQDPSFLSYFPRYFDFSIPYRPPEQFEDPYVILLNSSPRKEVPIGLDYQAKIPQWDVNDNKREQQLTGICVITTPDLTNSDIDGVKVGSGRTDCSCPDVGSTRCVQQHIREAREKLRETIGDEIFTELGFYNMGEEVVASKWTIDEEQIFHRVVFSNPISHGRDFWRHLSAVFPTRTKKELVSYYFNVFMLRRRATQNRSYLLEIDSDDDEERAHEDGQRGIHLDLCVVGGEEEDSIAQSFGDQGSDVGLMDGSGSEYEDNNCGISNNNHGVSDGDDNKQSDAVEMDGGRGQMSGQ
ncbi:hypothetical protein BUALT_Bualt17G0079400 [Buddleja alternifolia]|uniref:Myb-like domain-containing protein n=1 Tax=Buddleja alternifolia TaxID=168488 RepID=A0AAV6W6Z0_9LAMI|nr:hypothetical protein BUALT_Bualt17G0079400 [Buddleja alternifolia]